MKTSDKKRVVLLTCGCGGRIIIRGPPGGPPAPGEPGAGPTPFPGPLPFCSKKKTKNEMRNKFLFTSIYFFFYFCLIQIQFFSDPGNK